MILEILTSLVRIDLFFIEVIVEEIPFAVHEGAGYRQEEDDRPPHRACGGVPEGKTCKGGKNENDRRVRKAEKRP